MSVSELSVVGGDESVVTPAPPQALSNRVNPARVAGTARAVRRSEPPIRGSVPEIVVPSSQPMEARASAVVQLGACGLSRSCRPPSSRRPLSFTSSAPFLVGRADVVHEALAPVGLTRMYPSVWSTS